MKENTIKKTNSQKNDHQKGNDANLHQNGDGTNLHQNGNDAILQIQESNEQDKNNVKLTSILLEIIKDYKFIVILLLLIGIGVFLILDKEIPQPSLISMSYKLYNFNPHIVDLRTISTRGIPVAPNSELELVDLYLSVPGAEKLSKQNYFIQAEVYVKDTLELIGYSPKMLIDRRMMKLGSIAATDKYKSVDSNLPPETKPWIAQPIWKSLELLLVTYNQRNKIVGRDSITIPLNPTSTSWLISSPITTFVTIVYRINDGVSRMLNIKEINEVGLQANPGDRLILEEVWYHSEITDESQNIMLEAYLTKDGFERSTYYTSTSEPIRSGIRELSGFKPMEWQIPNDKDRLILSLVRTSDGVVVDRWALYAYIAGK